MSLLNGILGLICLCALLPLLHFQDWRHRQRRRVAFLEAMRMRLIMRAQLKRARRR